MKHRVGYNPLGRKPAHRKALHRNMVTSLFNHERITTTKAKAREIRRTAEKMITRAKIDSVHNRRMIARDIKDGAILAKLFVDIAPRYKERPGGYTRVLKIGYRQGDAAEMVLLELVEEEMPAKGTKGDSDSGRSAKAKKSSSSKSSETKSEKKPARKAVKPEEKAADAPPADDAIVDEGASAEDAAAEAVSEDVPADAAAAEEQTDDAEPEAVDNSGSEDEPESSEGSETDKA